VCPIGDVLEEALGSSLLGRRALVREADLCCSVLHSEHFRPFICEAAFPSALLLATGPIPADLILKAVVHVAAVFVRLLQ